MTILVTGASRGIGLALVEGYAALGQTVIGTTRSATPAEGEWLHADLADPDSIARLAAPLHGRPLDLLICNAGVYLDKGQRLATGYAAPLWADSFAVTVTGVFLTIQTLLPNIRAARGKIAII